MKLNALFGSVTAVTALTNLFDSVTAVTTVTNLFTEAKEQDRKDLLHWQQQLMGVFPDSYDVGLATRNPYGDVATRSPYSDGEFNVVTVARNSKELFYFDTRRSSDSFYSSIGVCGEDIRHFSIDAKDLQKSINSLMLIYELKRKVTNLMPNLVKCVIKKDNVRGSRSVLDLEIFSQAPSLDFIRVTLLRDDTYVVNVKESTMRRVIVSTKFDYKIIGMIEKAAKELFQ